MEDNLCFTTSVKTVSLIMSIKVSLLFGIIQFVTFHGNDTIAQTTYGPIQGEFTPMTRQFLSIRIFAFKVLLRWCYSILFEYDYDQLLHPNIDHVSLNLKYMIYTLINNVYSSSNDKYIIHKLII